MKIATNQERLNELFDSDPRNDTAIAQSLGVSKQTISSWRHGVRSPKKPVLIQIAKEFDVSIEWLMGFDVERKPTFSTSVVIADSELFDKLFYNMTDEDRATITAILSKTYDRMKSQGKI